MRSHCVVAQTVGAMTGLQAGVHQPGQTSRRPRDAYPDKYYSRPFSNGHRHLRKRNRCASEIRDKQPCNGRSLHGFPFRQPGAHLQGSMQVRRAKFAAQPRHQEIGAHDISTIYWTLEHSMTEAAVNWSSWLRFPAPTIHVTTRPYHPMQSQLRLRKEKKANEGLQTVL